MVADVRVAGVGMVPFMKPSAGARYENMGVGAVRVALADSGIGYDDVQEAYASYVYGDSTCGQVVLYSVGLSGIPIVNVNNNCASGSTALWQARKAIAGGEADVVLVSAEYAKNKGLDARVRIAGQGFTSDTPGSFTGDMRHVVGYDLSANAAADAHAQAGVGPDDIPVVELHDCFTANELITYESLGPTAEGTAEKFVVDGDNTYGGRVVTNRPAARCPRDIPSAPPASPSARS